MKIKGFPGLLKNSRILKPLKMRLVNSRVFKVLKDLCKPVLGRSS